MTIGKVKQDTYTCPRCHDVVPMDGTMDLYDVVMQHDTKCTNPPRHIAAIYEAETGQLVKPSLRVAVIDYAKRIGLEPELNHICLYHGKPWVTIDGWYYLFKKKYPEGVVNTRALHQDERKDALLEDNLHAWVAYAYDSPGGKLLAMGYGYARAGDEPLAYKSAVEPKWPWRLAEKRAEEDCYRKAVPLEINEEVNDGNNNRQKT